MADRMIHILEGVFVASHKHYGESLHGHNFRCRVELALHAVERNRRCFGQVIRTMDYRHLNRLPFFRTQPPSTENIARFVGQALEELGCRVISVEVFETRDCSGGFRSC